MPFAILEVPMLPTSIVEALETVRVHYHMPIKAIVYRWVFSFQSIWKKVAGVKAGCIMNPSHFHAWKEDEDGADLKASCPNAFLVYKHEKYEIHEKNYKMHFL